MVERSEIEETGEYDLEGLFVRLGSAIDSIKATRLVLDTIEVLYAGLSNAGIVRSELRRLFRWLKQKGITTIVTGERSADGLTTRHGIEEYVSDCVIFLDNRVAEGLSTRRLRITKYRGSSHSGNEFPFVIDENGFSVLPVTEVKLDYPASEQRVTTGVPQLDAMLDGRGYMTGSSILVSGMVGTGKTSLAACLVDAGCRQGKRCLYFAFEESPDQIIRNMRSIGVDLAPWFKKGLLRFHATRVYEQALEKHLILIQREAAEFKPEIVVVDAVSDFVSVGAFTEVRQMILRVVDFFKKRQITALFTSMSDRPDLEVTGVGLSSAFDTWIHLTNVQGNLERNRTLVIIKSRGMAHSNQVREFVVTGKGIELVDIYSSPSGAFMGTARLAQMAADKATDEMRRVGVISRERQMDEKRRAVEARIASLRADLEAEIKDSEVLIAQEKGRDKALATEKKIPGRTQGRGQDAFKQGQ